jgi:hypothetical protein
MRLNVEGSFAYVVDFFKNENHLPKKAFIASALLALGSVAAVFACAATISTSLMPSLFVFWVWLALVYQLMDCCGAVFVPAGGVEVINPNKPNFKILL